MVEEEAGERKTMTIDELMEKTFDSYKRHDEEHCRRNWIRKGKTGHSFVDGGYAKLITMEGKHYIVSEGGRVYPQGTVLELTQESADAYSKMYNGNGVNEDGTFCISSHGPAMSVMGLGTKVEGEEAEKVLKATKTSPGIIPGEQQCTGCGSLWGGSQICHVCKGYDPKKEMSEAVAGIFYKVQNNEELTSMEYRLAAKVILDDKDYVQTFWNELGDNHVTKSRMAPIIPKMQKDLEAIAQDIYSEED